MNISEERRAKSDEAIQETPAFTKERRAVILLLPLFFRSPLFSFACLSSLFVSRGARNGKWNDINFSLADALKVRGSRAKVTRGGEK